MKSDNTTDGSMSAREYRSILRVGEKARRTISFSDKNPNGTLHTVHHVESYKEYYANDKESCLKCTLL